jgi:high-affinity iron transporter
MPATDDGVIISSRIRQGGKPMEQMLVVTLREGIEAFLIVAITIAYLRKTGRDALLPPVWWGTGAAVLMSIILGVFLAEYAVQPVWEGALAATAAAMVISMVIYMLRTARYLRTNIGNRVEAALREPSRGAWIGIFLFVLLMMTREGMETALITATLARQSGSGQLLAGAVLGIFAAAGLAWAWSRYGHRVNLALFFQVTSIFLMLFAVQLLLYSFHEFTEAGVLPLDNQYWHDVTEEWAQGNYGQIVTYGLVLVPAAWLVLAHLRGRRIFQAA